MSCYNTSRIKSCIIEFIININVMFWTCVWLLYGCYDLGCLAGNEPRAIIKMVMLQQRIMNEIFMTLTDSQNRHMHEGHVRNTCHIVILSNKKNLKPFTFTFLSLVLRWSASSCGLLFFYWFLFLPFLVPYKYMFYLN